MKNLFQNGLLKEIELRTITKEAGFVDGEVFEQGTEFRLSVATREQAIVAVEIVETAGSESALQTVLQKVDATLVEVHSAFLIYERLQELKFSVANDDRYSASGH
jgi:hypothetical protein